MDFVRVQSLNYDQDGIHSDFQKGRSEIRSPRVWNNSKFLVDLLNFFKLTTGWKS